MSAFLYAALATALGLFVAQRIGRAAAELRAAGAWLSFSLISLLLAVFLSFALPVLVAISCHLVGLNERQCFKSDDQTVWWLALPLVALPGYLACMFAGRSAGRADPAAILRRADNTTADPYSAGMRAVLSSMFALIGLLFFAIALTSAVQAGWVKSLAFLVLSAGAGTAAYRVGRARKPTTGELRP